MRNFIVRLLTGFMPSKKARKRFRAKYMKVDPIWIVRDELKNHINYYINKRIADIANTMLDINSIPIATGNLRKLQLAKSKLSASFVKFLDENNLNYWLDYGTLLGAYRNKGFIQWDDDIDIGMMRNDLEKLKIILEHNDKFEWLDYLVPDIAKVNKVCLRNKSVDYCYSLDIFIYDYVDCDDKETYYQKYLEDKKNRIKELKKLNIAHCGVLEDKNALAKVNKVYNKYLKKYAGGGRMENTYCLV